MCFLLDTYVYTCPFFISYIHRNAFPLSLWELLELSVVDVVVLTLILLLPLWKVEEDGDVTCAIWQMMVRTLYVLHSTATLPGEGAYLREHWWCIILFAHDFVITSSFLVFCLLFLCSAWRVFLPHGFYRSSH